MAIEASTARADVSSGALAKAATLSTAKSPNPIWKAVVPVAVAVILALLPLPTGLPQHAWYFFSLFVGVLLGLVLQPLPRAPLAITGFPLGPWFPPFFLSRPHHT